MGGNMLLRECEEKKICKPFETLSRNGVKKKMKKSKNKYQNKKKI